MATLAHHILLADDEPEILSEMTSYLRRRGHIVVPVSSKIDGIRAYQDNAERFALVVTDMQMPDGNGCDLARFVIDHSRGTRGICPCLIISGNFDVNGLPADLRAAGVGSLAKPFSLSFFYASVLVTVGMAGKPAGQLSSTQPVLSTTEFPLQSLSK